MSRIGKQPITIPQGVEISASGGIVAVKGPKGSLAREFPGEVKIEIANGILSVVPGAKTKRTPAIWGLARAVIAHMVEGVTKGFEKKLEIEGVGYRVSQEGKDLVFLLGFSHPVRFPAPPGIDFKVEKNTIAVSGFDKELVGQVSAEIRALKKPEPYKGKGIRYQGEVVRRKAGKKAAA